MRTPRELLFMDSNSIPSWCSPVNVNFLIWHTRVTITTTNNQVCGWWFSFKVSAWTIETKTSLKMRCFLPSKVNFPLLFFLNLNCSMVIRKRKCLFPYQGNSPLFHNFSLQVHTVYACIYNVYVNVYLINQYHYLNK